MKGLSEYHDLPRDSALHRAEADAYLTFELFKVLMEKLKHRGPGTIIEGIRFQGDYESGVRLGWGVSQDFLAEIPESPGVFSLLNIEKNISFQASAHNLLREIRKLQRYGSLPKPLLRAVLQTEELKFDVVESPFAACLLEASQTEDNAPYLEIANWHQRAANFLILMTDKDGFRLTTGPVNNSTLVAVGPIRGGKEVQDFLSQVGDACGRKPTKRGFKLNETEATQLMEVLAPAENEGVFERLLSSLVPGFLSRKKKSAGVFKNLKLPGSLRSLVHLSGLIGDPTGEGWQIYSVVAGELTKEMHVTGETFKEGLSASNTHQQLVKKIRSRMKEFSYPMENLKDGDCVSINRIFWWVHFGSRRDGVQYLSITELENLSSGE